MALSNKYPLKFGVLYVLVKENRDMTVEEVYQELSPVFGGEKSFIRKNIRFHLDSMVGIGMMKMTNEYIDDNGELVASYVITPFGRERTAMLPDEYRASLQEEGRTHGLQNK
jgi:hypothetical protein